MAFAQDVEDRLQLLATIAEVLGLDDIAFSSYSSAILRLSAEGLSCTRLFTRLTHLESDLRVHLTSLRYEKEVITRWTDMMQDEQPTGDSILALERRKEALVKKAKEYQKELQTLMAELPERPSVTVTDLIARQDRIKQKERQLKATRAKIKAFQGLPPDIDLARLELQAARNEQMKLFQLRERLLRKMADVVV